MTEMKLLIDDADISEIRRLYEYYPLDGVTTNPTILARTGKDPAEVLHQIRDFIGKDALLFVQVTSADCQGMLEDARAIVRALGSGTVVQIPAVSEGFKAIRQLKQEGITTCGTAVYTPMQAYLAAKSGAGYVAPYVNRIDNMGFDGTETVRKIQNIIENSDYECTVLAASFKNSQQVLELCEYGIGAATCSPAVIEGFCQNPAIDSAVNAFLNDFSRTYGKTIRDLLEK